MTEGERLIDVQSLLTQSSPDELNQLAEEYFARLTNWNYHLSKPFGDVEETPQLLINFAVILQGLKICPGMTVMEFGAGTCWASRFLSQLGCHVIAADVSATALRIGAELYTRQPIIGDKPKPRFLLFDGRRFDLADESVDRIMCLDAFHHVPNPGEVLAELSRVLKPGGIAGLAEPGPNHSKSAQSQYEMKTYGVIENDVDIREIWHAAQRAGFTHIKLALFNVPPVHVEIHEFDNFLSGRETGRWTEATRGFLENQRNFFLYKGEPVASDSRFRAGLMADIRIGPNALVVNEGQPITLQANVTNTSKSIWLPRSSGLGAVHLGCHVYDRQGKIFRHSYHWEALHPGDGRPVFPEESVAFEVKVPALPKGGYLLEFDMVSNDVCWFALNGSLLVRVRLDVV